MSRPATFVLSVDVEDYFHVEAFAGGIPRDTWDTWPSRIVANTRRALDLCDAYGVKGTFFVLGWVARKFPALVREIQARGHELACHSYWHRLVYSLTPEAFRQDLIEARDAIEQAGGVRVAGYRAPSWSITAQAQWALDILTAENFTYDSSIYPVRHDIYGFPGASRTPSRIRPTLVEFPPATVKLGWATLPCAGGGSLRILPFSFTRWALRQIEREDGRAIVIYFHPWELDPAQPRIAGPLKSRFRHYTNLAVMESRLRALLSQGMNFRTFGELAGSQDWTT